MRSFYTDKPRMVLFEFLEDRIGLMWTPDFQALGRVVGGKLVGVCGFNSFNGASCQMHMAGDRGWITRGMIETAFRYAFILRGLNVVFGVVPSGNVEALDVDRRLGFTELVTVPGAHPDGALHLLQMRREACRWITRKNYGQENHAYAA